VLWLFVLNCNFKVFIIFLFPPYLKFYSFHTIISLLLQAYKRVGGMIHSADVGRGVIGVMDVTNLMVCTL
jgi:hypothetical protein